MNPEDYIYHSIWDYLLDSSIAYMVLMLGICLLMMAVIIAILGMFGALIPLELKWKRGEIKYSIRFGWLGFWWKIWTPEWHGGRGQYISIGLVIIAFYRRY